MQSVERIALVGLGVPDLRDLAHAPTFAARASIVAVGTCRSVEKPQGIFAVIDVVDALAAGFCNEAEQRAGPGLAVRRLDVYLLAAGGRFDDVPVTGIRGQDVAVGRKRQPQGLGGGSEGR